MNQHSSKWEALMKNSNQLKAQNKRKKDEMKGDEQNY